MPAPNGWGGSKPVSRVAMPPSKRNRPSELERLARLISRLRSPRGCPWDRKQTHVSLIPYLREEAAELALALKRGKPHEIEDELGDLLLNVFLHAQIAGEKGLFDINDVARSQVLKLRRRHPHVFGKKKFKTAGAVLRNWKEVKDAERTLRDREVRARFKGAASWRSPKAAD